MKLFKKRTLDEVLATFGSALNELEVLIAGNEEKVDANTVQMDTLREENLTLMAESRRATKVRENIKKLIEE